MYVPALLGEKETAVLHDMIRQAQLVTLVTAGANGLVASHVPMLLDATRGPHGTLRGHLARANPQGKERAPDAQALAIFLGPEAYISPAWYPTKRETGKVVPTWNYVAVHATGPIRFFDDAERLLAQVIELTQRHEAPRDAPWAVSDAPADFIQVMLKAIVGFEIEIAMLEGKWKMSQNRPVPDRVGVAEGLRREGGPAEAAVADIVVERNK
jgi:transcriptional regulator